MYLKGSATIILTGGSTAGVAVAGDDSRKAQTAEVEAEPLVVVFSEQLGVHLAHTVDGARPLHRHVGSRVARRVWPERADRARHEDLQTVLFGQLHHVVHP